MQSWQDWYDNLLPEDFGFTIIHKRCNCEELDDFLAEFNDADEYFEKTNLKKEEAVTSSPTTILRRNNGNEAE
jgi:hypothetical protein